MENIETGYDESQYKAIKRLYRFHEQRRHLEMFFFMLLPRLFTEPFFKTYSVDNAFRRNVLLSLIKVVLIAVISYNTLLFFNVTQWQIVAIIFFVALWLYIISASYQIFTRTDLFKNDFLMIILGTYKQRLMTDEINRRTWHSFMTTLMPLTVLMIIRIAIDNGTLILIPAFLLGQIMAFNISRFFVVKRFYLKYIVYRHSFYRDVIVSFLNSLVMIFVFVLAFSPIALIDETSVTLGTYMFGFAYMILISVGSHISFQQWLKRFIHRHNQRIMHPESMPISHTKGMRYFHHDSLFLKGLDAVEKAIVIKDQKMYKRKNRKDYYGTLWFGMILIVTTVQYMTDVNDGGDFISIFILTLIYSGMAFLFHMLSTAMAGRYLSYQSEGVLAQTYQRLSVSKKQLFRAKMRMFVFMTMPITVIYLLSLSTLLWHLSLNGLLLFLFNGLYFIGLTRFRLRQYIHLDLNNRSGYNNYYHDDVSNKGTAILIGLFFTFLVPLGVGMFTNALSDALSMSYVYLMLGSIILIILVANGLNDRTIHNAMKPEEAHND